MAAPKGNTFALGNNGGRPPKYKTPEELAEAAEQYLQKDVPKSITGLALALGFDSRQSLYDYEKKKEFSYIIKRAKLVVENYYELSLHEGNATGAIFALKNMGWSDKRNVDVTTKGEAIKGSPIIVNSQGEMPDVQ